MSGLQTYRVSVRRRTEPIRVTLYRGASAGGDLSSPSFAMAKIAAAAVSGHRGVVETAAGHVVHADPLIESHGDTFLGISLNGALIGLSVLVALSGKEIVEPSWAWTPYEPIFVGLNGQLTQAAPEAPMRWDICVGVATSPTSIRVAIEPPIFLED